MQPAHHHNDEQNAFNLTACVSQSNLHYCLAVVHYCTRTTLCDKHQSIACACCLSGHAFFQLRSPQEHCAVEHNPCYKDGKVNPFVQTPHAIRSQNLQHHMHVGHADILLLAMCTQPSLTGSLLLSVQPEKDAGPETASCVAHVSC